MLTSTKPYGARMVPGNNTKLKGAVLLQALGQWPYWSQFWRDWDWTTIQRTIDNLANLGVNCLQFTATGLDDGGVTHPNDTVMRSRITQLAQYAASKGMTLNPQLGYQPAHSFANGATVATAAAVRMAKLFCEQQNIAFIDIMNEVNYFPPAAWGGTSNQAAPNSQALADIAQMNAGVRAVTGNVPITWSIGCQLYSDYSGSWSKAMAPFTDFHNVHAYTFQQQGGTTFNISDLSGLRSATWYKGSFVIGEIGVPSNRGTALQTSWLTSAQAVYQAGDCLGGIVWGATDTSYNGSTYNVSDFGIFDSTGTTIRPALSVPLSNSIGVL